MNTGAHGLAIILKANNFNFKYKYWLLIIFYLCHWLTILSGFFIFISVYFMLFIGNPIIKKKKSWIIIRTENREKVSITKNPHRWA